MPVKRATLPALTEKQFMAQVVELATVLGWSVYHTFDSRRSAAGWPDLALWRQGTFALVELKRAGGKVSVAQQLTIAGLREAGVCAGVWRPGDWGAITQWMQRPNELPWVWGAFS